MHIPLVCFRIVFPAMVLFAEWRYLQIGHPLFRTLAMRWSKVTPSRSGQSRNLKEEP